MNLTDFVPLLAEISNGPAPPRDFWTNFLDFGAADVAQTLLVCGLLYGLWNLRIPPLTIRPLRHFFTWAARYPFPSLVLIMLTLMVLGFVGKGMGLQSLFLDDNPLIQLLLGFLVALVMFAITNCYFLLDPQFRGWGESLEVVIGSGFELSGVFPRPMGWIKRHLVNGYLEKLDRTSLQAIYDSIQAIQHPDRTKTEDVLAVEEVICGERFRLMFSPAVLIAFTIPVVMIVGVSPMVFAQHKGWTVFWFLGNLLGAVCAVLLSLWMTKRLAHANQWTEAEIDREVRTLKAFAIPSRTPEPPKTRAEGIDAWVRNAGVAFLLVIHPAATLFFKVPNDPDKLTWLLVEICASFVAAALLGCLVFLWDAHSVGEKLHGRFGRHQTRLLLAAGVLLAGLATAFVVRDWERDDAIQKQIMSASHWEFFAALDAFWAAVMIGLYFAIWGFGFWGATRGAEPARPRWWDHLALVLVVIGYGFLANADGSTPRHHQIAALCGIVAILVFEIPRLDWKTGGGKALAGIMLAAVPLVLLFFVPAALAAFTAAIALLIALMIPGRAALRRLGVSDDPETLIKKPGMILPASSVLAFIGFATFHAGLPEFVQAKFPSGASVAIFMGVVASIYMLVKFASRRRIFVLGAVVVVMPMMINGNSWLVRSNEYKLQFPGMEAYYNENPDQKDLAPKSPALLDSRAYFRSTTSVVKIRDPQALAAEAIRTGQNLNRIPGSVLFVPAIETSPNAQNAKLVLNITDPAGNLRLAPGDSVSLYLPEEILQFDADPKSAISEWRFLSQPVDKDAQHVQLASYANADQIRLRFDRPLKVGGEPKSAFVIAFNAKTTTGSESKPHFESRIVGDRLSLTIRGVGESRGNADLLSRMKVAYASPVYTEKAAEPADPAKKQPLASSNITLAEEDLMRPADVKPWKNRLDAAHLVHERPPFPRTESAALRERLQMMAADAKARAKDGRCFVLQYDPHSTSRTDTKPPIPLATFTVKPSDGKSPFADLPAYLTLDPASLEDAIHRAFPRDPDRPNHNNFTMRVAHDRGVFHHTHSDDKGFHAEIARGDRVRNGDLLILSWRDSPAGDLRSSETRQVFEVEVPDKSPTTGGIALVTLKRKWAGEAGDAALPPSDVKFGGWEILRQLDNLEVLEAWRLSAREGWRSPPRKTRGNETLPPQTSAAQGEQPRAEKPPLVIVTVSGGGIRASVWTATVLAALEKDLGQTFPHHIRLITGASGGMVAAGNFAARLRGPQSPMERETSEGWIDTLAANQLDSVAGSLVFNDIPALLNPIRRNSDRGRKLEEAWKRITAEADGPSAFATKFRDLSAGERAGWRPSLVFTPMMVEDGRRLFISNLDLGFVARNYGRMLTDYHPERSLDPTYINDLRPNAASRADDELFSLSAVEFFRLFPDASKLEVGTAVRMSASFPFIAPPVSLPTTPPRRVVDAGYYDNYGVNVAAQWLTEYRDWIQANTSGVVVVQIRDGVSQDARAQIGFDRAKDTEAAERSALDQFTWGAIGDVLNPGFYPLTTPLQGVSNAREWSMSFRNDEQIELFDELVALGWDKNEPNDDFFRTIVFECPVAASTSWRLDEREKRRIKNGMGPPKLDADEVIAFLLTEKTALAKAGKDPSADQSQETSERANETRQQRIDDQRVAFLKNQLLYPDVGGDGFEENRKLYESVLSNMRRRNLLKAWWRERVPKP